MSTEDKEGSYCNICGGISPAKIKTKCISVDGKDIGIDRLDDILAEVRALELPDDRAITEELLRRAMRFNYIPTSRSKAYGEALLKEYSRTE